MDVIFEVETWSFFEAFNEWLEMNDEYKGDESASDKAIEEYAEEFTEEHLINCAQDKLDDFGVPIQAHKKATLTHKGYNSLVEIECSFLIESLESERHAERTAPLCDISVDPYNFTFTASTREAILTAAMDAAGDYGECSKKNPIEQFGQMEAYCLPWYTHWLLDRGYDVTHREVGEDTRFHVHFYEYRLIPYSGDVDDMDPDDILLIKNPSRPILG